jgi:small ligand-binding sensory domain FIST
MSSTSALASTEFRWASGFSENPNLDVAVAEACAAVRTGLGGASPDIAVIFVSGALEGQYQRAAPAIMEALKPRVLVGTTGMGVIGVGREVEERAAVSISAGRLPGIHIAPFRLLAQKLEELDVSPANWSHFLGCPKEGPVHFLLFAHPFSTPVDELVGALDQAFPEGKKVGGMASGGHGPETMAVFEGTNTHFEGAVGCAIWGNVDFDVIVAQGCRPVGPQLKITKAAGPDLYEIDGERAVDRLTAVLNSIPEEDRLLARRSVFVGVAMAAREGEADKPYDGGYVVRNIMGVDPTRGIVRVGHQFHEGQTIRLQVRDARTAEQELVGLLERYKREHEVMPGTAAFMFQCNGRGTNLFGEEGHDARVFREGLGAMPLAGFFCNGEIGPVGEVTYVHGYTSSIGILRPRPS